MVAAVVNNAEVERLLPLFRTLALELATAPPSAVGDVAAAIGSEWPPFMVAWLRDRLDTLRRNAGRCLDTYRRVAGDRDIDIDTFADDLGRAAQAPPETVERLRAALYRLRAAQPNNGVAI